MFLPPAFPWTVPGDKRFERASVPTTPPDDVADKKALKKELKRLVERISDTQRQLYADNRYSILLVFQAMDAAGKDGTIRAVQSGVNPAGVHVSSFKAPSSEELEHDFLWRTTKRLPERGRIGIFNRSYYEEVLAVKVRPAFLAAQNLPEHDPDTLWQHRYESIRDHELHLARNGTVILKFWLNVSKEEQKKRFLERLTNPEKHWKFSKSDLETRSRWDDYMAAYEDLLSETSRPHAPWLAIPADNKPYMRVCVARAIAETMEALPLEWPEKTAEELALFDEHIAALQGE
ncbi:MAG: phosphate--nucleotide phosphotransferase [Gammaproteobacteria bacterium]|nr:MAG: phosphate--nucleotide phosphotransferase [Gammaproteobacteria bacterium]